MGHDYAAVFILNNDTVVSEDCLTELVAAVAKLPERSVLGYQVRYCRQPEIIWHFGARWDERKLKLRKVARGQSPDEWRLIEPASQIIGCTIFVPIDVLQEVGPFDVRFFLNFEETD